MSQKHQLRGTATMRTLGTLACCLIALTSHYAFAADAKPESPAEPKLTIVNIASHCDWSWAHTRAWHENRYADIIHDYLLLMRTNPKLVWQFETVNEQLLPFLVKARQQWPEMIDEFWQRVKEGRIEIVCGYSNPRLSEVYPELFVRSLVLGKEYCRRHVPGLRQKVLEVPDVMCGTSQIPQILSLADYDYFMFTRKVGQQAVFWRKGLDGTRMLSCKDCYGYPELQGTPGAAFPGINPVPVWRYAVGHDDMSPTQTIVDQAIAGDPNKRTLSTMLRFFQECEKYSGQITELSGSLDSCNFYLMAGMRGSHNIHTLHNRSEDILLSLEKAQTMAAMLDQSFYSEPVDSLWQDVLSYSGHAIEWCWKEDYAERMAHGRHAQEKANRFLEEALCAIAGSIPFVPNRGTPLVVFNFQSWPVSGPVEFAIDGGAEGLSLTDSDGKTVPLQFVAEDVENGPRAAFNATTVPACGFKTYYVTRVKNAAPLALNDGKTATPTIENEFYRIAVRSNGQLEIFDKERQVLLGAPQTGGLGDLVIYDMPPPTEAWVQVGPAGKRRDWQPSVAQCRAVQGPAFASLTIPGKIDHHAITREVRLCKGSRRIEFDVDLNTAQHDNGILCIRFPIGLSGKVVAGIPFGVESRDSLEKEPFRGESFCTGFPEGYDATRWTDVSSEKFGYTFICPPGMHTGYVFKKADQSIEFILDSLKPMPKDEFIRTSLSMDGRGHHHWRCALLPHTGDWSDAKSYRHALEQHVPLLAWSTAYGLGRGGVASIPISNKPDRPKQDAPPSNVVRPQTAASLVEVTPANVILSAMRLVPSVKPAEKPLVELRLYESAGKPADVVIRLAHPAASAEQTNFLGEPIPNAGKVEITNNELRFHIEPWKIVTLRVKGK
jgi:alpha-mannosidase